MVGRRREKERRDARENNITLKGIHVSYSFKYLSCNSITLSSLSPLFSLLSQHTTLNVSHRTNLTSMSVKE